MHARLLPEGRCRRMSERRPSPWRARRERRTWLLSRPSVVSQGWILDLRLGSQEPPRFCGTAFAEKPTMVLSFAVRLSGAPAIDLVDASENGSAVFSLPEKRLCGRGSGDTTSGLGGSPTQTLGKRRVKGGEARWAPATRLGGSALPASKRAVTHSQQVVSRRAPVASSARGELTLDLACPKDGTAGTHRFPVSGWASRIAAGGRLSTATTPVSCSLERRRGEQRLAKLTEAGRRRRGPPPGCLIRWRLPSGHRELPQLGSRPWGLSSSTRPGNRRALVSRPPG